MATVQSVLTLLRTHAFPEKLAGSARFGIPPGNRFGVSMPQIRAIARQLGRNHDLAIGLWQSGNSEARIVAGLIADPKALTAAQMESWVRDFDAWDVCDQACMNLFDRSPLALQKVECWAAAEGEFVRRAAFATIAAMAVHDKKSPDSRFVHFLPLIRAAAIDERNFVKKAVNWALRQIGKRNLALNAAAIAEAELIAGLASKAARWIAADALRELRGGEVQQRLADRATRNPFGDL
jgi:3-methyladenine DNA glycosylase AlkD